MKDKGRTAGWRRLKNTGRDYMPGLEPRPQGRLLQPPDFVPKTGDARRGQRPIVCEASALTTELTAHT